MVSTQNPEEGRLSEEDKAELLQKSRKKTVEMRREYRRMRQEKAAKDRADRWAANHKEQHEENYKEIQKASSNGPGNRRTRRRMAKTMNVFKSPGGWQTFNKHYGDKFGRREPFVKSKQSEYKSNIVQALAAANVTPEKEDE